MFVTDQCDLGTQMSCAPCSLFCASRVYGFLCKHFLNKATDASAAAASLHVRVCAAPYFCVCLLLSCELWQALSLCVCINHQCPWLCAVPLDKYYTFLLLSDCLELCGSVDLLDFCFSLCSLSRNQLATDIRPLCLRSPVTQSPRVTYMW